MGVLTAGTEVQLGVLSSIPAWLVAPARGEVVVDALTRAVPELVAGSLRIVECEPKLRLKSDRPGWSVSYELEVEDRDGVRSGVRLAGTLLPPGDDPMHGDHCDGTFGGPGWRCVLVDLGLDLATAHSDDGALPALASLTEPSAAAALLQEAIAAGPYPGMAIAAVRPDVRRYKPGSRCTIFYHLDLAPGSVGPSAVVAKTYRGDKGANAFSGMAALWTAMAGPEAPVVLAEPLAYLAELRVLVQSSVPEDQTLKELVRDAIVSFMADGRREPLDTAAHRIDQTAEGLAALHGSGVSHGAVVLWDDELGEARELLERLAPNLSDVAAATAELLDDLDQLARRIPAGEAVPTHRSFRPAQVLLGDDRIAFIDFDGLCMAEPALDVALFRAALRDAGTRPLATADASPTTFGAAADVLDDLGDRFLSRYQHLAPVSAARVALWENLDLVTSVLHCWTKVKPERLVTRIALLRRHLQQSAVLT